MADFRGFPSEAFSFFADLEQDNSKAFWQVNKPTWEEAVRAPMVALVNAMPAEFQPFRVFRMNRDVRFSPDKSPYKTMTGAVHESVNGAVHYTHASNCCAGRAA